MLIRYWKTHEANNSFANRNSFIALCIVTIGIYATDSMLQINTFLS